MKTFGIVMLIVGTVIGAGFASGKELCVFFLRYGDGAYALAAFAGVLFFLAFWGILSAAQLSRGGGVELFHRNLYGKANGIGVMILLTNNMLVTSSMLGSFDVIIPCAAFPVGSVVFGLLCYVLLLAGHKGLVRINVVAVPLIFVMLVVVCLYGIFDSQEALRLPSQAASGQFAACLYVGMNVLTLGAVLSGTETTRKGRLATAAFASGIITLLMMLELAAIRSYGIEVYDAEMPLLAIAETLHMGIVVRIVMALGIFTTLASCAHTVGDFIMPLVRNRRAVALLPVFLVGFGISRFGFGNIVSSLYPVLGALGLVELGACALFLFRSGWRGKLPKFLRKKKSNVSP